MLNGMPMIKIDKFGLIAQYWGRRAVFEGEEVLIAKTVGRGNTKDAVGRECPTFLSMRVPKDSPLSHSEYHGGKHVSPALPR